MADFDNAPADAGGEDDLHADLSAAFAVAESAPEPVASPDPVESASPDASAAQRARDEAGRFAKAAEDAAANPEQVAAPEITDHTADAEIKEAPVEVPILAPVSWSAEDKAEFAKLTPAAQKIIAKRESERDRAFQQKADEAAQLKRRYDGIEQVLAPRRQEIAMSGMTEAQAIGQLAAINDFAKKDPAGYIQWAAQQLKVDLGQIAAPAEQQQTDPQYRALNERLSRFEQHQVQQQRAAAEAQQRAQQQAHQMSLSDIEAFASEADASGAPARPYFQHVLNDLLPITQLIRQTNPQLPNREVLQQAYERAVWANPETRAAVQELSRRQDEAKRTADAAKKAADAKRAASSITGAPGGVAAAGPKDTLREELAAAFGA